MGDVSLLALSSFLQLHASHHPFQFIIRACSINLWILTLACSCCSTCLLLRDSSIVRSGERRLCLFCFFKKSVAKISLAGLSMQHALFSGKHP